MCGDKTGKKKDVSFLWTLYHKAMAVKLLRTQVGSEIEDNCIMCDLRPQCTAFMSVQEHN
jgi:hypothetical protein